MNPNLPRRTAKHRQTIVSAFSLVQTYRSGTKISIPVPDVDRGPFKLDEMFMIEKYSGYKIEAILLAQNMEIWQQNILGDYYSLKDKWISLLQLQWSPTNLPPCKNCPFVSWHCHNKPYLPDNAEDTSPFRCNVLRLSNQSNLYLTKYRRIAESKARRGKS